MDENKDPNIFQLIGTFIAFTRKNLLVIAICTVVCGAIGFLKTDLHNEYTLVQAVVKINLVPGDVVHLILDKANQITGYSDEFDKNIITGTTSMKPLSDISGSLGWNDSEIIELNYTLKKPITSEGLDKELSLLLKDNKQISHYFQTKKNLATARLEEIDKIIKEDKEMEDPATKLRLVDAKVTTQETLSKDIYEILSFQSKNVEEQNFKPIVGAVFAGIVLGYIIAVLLISLKASRDIKL